MKIGGQPEEEDKVAVAISNVCQNHSPEGNRKNRQSLSKQYNAG